MRSLLARNSGACVLALALGCGADLQVVDDDGRGGGGASGLGGGGAGGHGGGESAPLAVCSDIVEVGGPVIVPLGGSLELDNPQLGYGPSDGAVRLAVSGSVGGERGLGATTFEPWGAWPPALEAPALWPFPHHDMVLDRGPGGATALAGDWDEMWLLDLEGGAEPLLLPGTEAVPTFLVHSGEARLWHRRTESSHFEQSAALESYSPATGVAREDADVCGSYEGRASAMPDGFIVLVERFGAMPACDGPWPRTLERYRFVDGSGAEVERTGATEVLSRSYQTQLTARSDGAWLIDQPAPDYEEGPFHVLRLDADAAPVDGEWLKLTSPYERDARFAFAAHGDGVVAAWVGVIEPVLHLQVLEPDGVRSAFRTFKVPLGLDPEQIAPMVLLSSPDRRSILVLRQVATGDLSGARLELRRYDCVEGG